VLLLAEGQGVDSFSTYAEPSRLSSRRRSAASTGTGVTLTTRATSASATSTSTLRFSLPSLVVCARGSMLLLAILTMYGNCVGRSSGGSCGTLDRCSGRALRCELVLSIIVQPNRRGCFDSDAA